MKDQHGRTLEKRSHCYGMNSQNNEIPEDYSLWF